MKLFTLFALALVAVSSPARAEIKELIAKLDLSPAQKEQIDTIRQKHREGLKGLKKSVEDSRKELLDALRAPKKGKDYQRELRAKFERAQALRQDLSRKRFEKALEIREVLDEKQLTKLEVKD